MFPPLMYYAVCDCMYLCQITTQLYPSAGVFFCDCEIYFENSSTLHAIGGQYSMIQSAELFSVAFNCGVWQSCLIGQWSCASASFAQCPGCTSVYLSAASLQNLAVPQDFYSPLSVPLEWSCWPHIRWCGTGRVSREGPMLFYWPSCSNPNIVLYSFSLSLLSVYRLVLWGWGVRNV